MSTLRNYFISLVDDGARRCHDNEELFCAAQVAPTLPTPERWRWCRYLPRYAVLFFFVLKLPDQFRKLGILLIDSVFEGFCVVIEPLLEGRLADTEVTDITTWLVDSCFVNNAAFAALAVQRAVSLGPAITPCLIAWIYLLGLSLDLDIMAIQYCFHIRHAAVAQFDWIFIEQLMVLVVFWEMFGEQAEEIFANIWLNVEAERWIKPDFVSSPCFSPCARIWREGKTLLVATLFKSSVIVGQIHFCCKICPISVRKSFWGSAWWWMEGGWTECGCIGACYWAF